ncbi:Photosynthetic NDH subunit of lumenal location 3, chloroplastic [Sesamum angolense]|uniref:Photosynthetic NDH subunit of lumenal location 3, chloroplastic n=1 Tax=Sesamum angolense TaxID=2727404 RepID=A0AAE1WRX8_9LAMI|nr:Photosynthetic NDH subunit of lumenal location 3, chloroplastic [Sesamum angolense]
MSSKQELCYYMVGCSHVLQDDITGEAIALDNNVATAESDVCFERTSHVGLPQNLEVSSQVLVRYGIKEMTNLSFCKDIPLVDSSSRHSCNGYCKSKFIVYPTGEHFLKLRTAMATTANLNGIFEALPAVPRHRGIDKNPKKGRITCFLDKKKDEVQATRRLAIGLASIALFGNVGIGKSLAEDNGFWLTGPLPVPYANNKINNEETGTRSFLKKGIYIANIGTKGECTAPVDDKKSLTDLANRLFDNVEKLEDAVRKQNVSQTESSYQATTLVLQEVMNRMA